MKPSVLAGAVFFCLAAASAAAATDAEVRQMIVAESIRAYSGSCPCPYNVDRGGWRCGGQSAYSRLGGASPICFPEQVTDDQVRRYRSRNNIDREGQARRLARCFIGPNSWNWCQRPKPKMTTSQNVLPVRFPA